MTPRRPPAVGFVLYGAALAALAFAAPALAMLTGAVAAPLLLGRRWGAASRAYGWSLFLRAKIASVLACAAALSASVLLGASDGTLRAIAAGFVSLNIAEACALDLAHRAWPRALAGALLIAGVWRFDASTGAGRALLTTSWPWIIAYTAWNASFVYDRWEGRSFGQHAAVLGGAFVAAALLGPEHWLWARTVTLAIHMVLLASFFDRMRADWETHGLRREPVVVASHGLVLVLAASSLLS